jgi:hypothetical protein
MDKIDINKYRRPDDPKKLHNKEELPGLSETRRKHLAQFGIPWEQVENAESDVRSIWREDGCLIFVRNDDPNKEAVGQYLDTKFKEWQREGEGGGLALLKLPIRNEDDQVARIWFLVPLASTESTRAAKITRAGLRNARDAFLKKVMNVESSNVDRQEVTTAENRDSGETKRLGPWLRFVKSEQRKGLDERGEVKTLSAEEFRRRHQKGTKLGAGECVVVYEDDKNDQMVIKESVGGFFQSGQTTTEAVVTALLSGETVELAEMGTAIAIAVPKINDAVSIERFRQKLDRMREEARGDKDKVMMIDQLKVDLIHEAERVTCQTIREAHRAGAVIHDIKADAILVRDGNSVTRYGEERDVSVVWSDFNGGCVLPRGMGEKLKRVNRELDEYCQAATRGDLPLREKAKSLEALMTDIAGIVGWADMYGNRGTGTPLPIIDPMSFDGGVIEGKVKNLLADMNFTLNNIGLRSKTRTDELISQVRNQLESGLVERMNLEFLRLRMQDWITCAHVMADFNGSNPENDGKETGTTRIDRWKFLESRCRAIQGGCKTEEDMREAVTRMENLIMRFIGEN